MQKFSENSDSCNDIWYHSKRLQCVNILYHVTSGYFSLKVIKISVCLAYPTVRFVLYTIVYVSAKQDYEANDSKIHRFKIDLHKMHKT